MLQRFEEAPKIPAFMELTDMVDVEEEFRRLYFNIDEDTEPVAQDMLRMVTDDGRIMYGSNFPHSPVKVVIEKKVYFKGKENRNFFRRYRKNKSC